MSVIIDTLTTLKCRVALLEQVAQHPGHNLGPGLAEHPPVNAPRRMGRPPVAGIMLRDKALHLLAEHDGPCLSSREIRARIDCPKSTLTHAMHQLENEEKVVKVGLAERLSPIWALPDRADQARARLAAPPPKPPPPPRPPPAPPAWDRGLTAPCGITRHGTTLADRVLAHLAHGPSTTTQIASALVENRGLVHLTVQRLHELGKVTGPTDGAVRLAHEERQAA